MIDDILRKVVFLSMRINHTCQMWNSADGDVFYSRSDLRLTHHSLVQSLEETLYCFYHDEPNPLVFRSNNLDPNNFVIHALIVVHFLVKRDIVLKALRLLIVTNYHQALNSMDYQGALPLHIACKWQNWKVISSLQAIIPTLPGVKTTLRKCHPLQIALINFNHNDTETTVICSKYMDESVAVLLKANIDVLTLPYKPNPIEDNECALIGFLPFHLACSKDFSLTGIYLILRSYPSAVSLCYG